MKTEKNNIPAEGLEGLKQNFSKDALSGFLVFLLALPLSLGIAKASDFPAIFGLVTAIIGGVVVSFFAGSRLTIKGPAAGLIVIASGCVSAYGGGEMGWHLALGAIVVAGIVQILFGVFKLGSFADFFPSAAIHGMLAAIGIIIMSKQIHSLLGIDPKLLKGKEPLELLAMIPESIMHENAHLTEIGLACLAIMIGLSYVKNNAFKKIPPPLVVLLIAIPLGFILHVKSDFKISNYSLVKIGNLFSNFSNGLLNVNFGGFALNAGTFIQYVILFALIGSIESLLTAKAIDDLDPYARKSDFNKDLTAVGIGNVLSGLLGGLPMISEVARSSANVSNGAQTRWANFFHGLFLLIAVLFAVPFIEMIPNTALAAMLIFVGFRLAHPREFKHMYHIGIEQLIIFVTTIIVTLSTDLLIGVGTGIVLEMIVNLMYGAKLKNLLMCKFKVIGISKDEKEIIIEEALVFSNNLKLKNFLSRIGFEKSIKLHFKDCKVIDHTSMEVLHKIARKFRMAGGHLDMTGVEELKPVGSDATSALKFIYKIKDNLLGARN